LRGCVPVRWHISLNAGADACEPSETRIGCEPLLPAGICLFINQSNIQNLYNRSAAVSKCGGAGWVGRLFAFFVGRLSSEREKTQCAYLRRDGSAGQTKSLKHP